jgi:hypothetical protein
MKNRYTVVTMATPSKVQLDVTLHPSFYLPDVNEESAKKASELLQRNHEDHHIFFNSEGFHVRIFYLHLVNVGKST